MRCLEAQIWNSHPGVPATFHWLKQVTGLPRFKARGNSLSLNGRSCKVKLQGHIAKDRRREIVFCGHFSTLLPMGIPPSSGAWLPLSLATILSWSIAFSTIQKVLMHLVLQKQNKTVDFVMRWEETVEIFCTITVSPHFSWQSTKGLFNLKMYFAFFKQKGKCSKFGIFSDDKWLSVVCYTAGIFWKYKHNLSFKFKVMF